MGEAKRRKMLDPNFGKSKREWKVVGVKEKDWIKVFAKAFEQSHPEVWTAIPLRDRADILKSQKAFIFRQSDRSKNIVICFPCVRQEIKGSELNSIAVQIFHESVSKLTESEHKTINKIIYGRISI